MLGSSGWRLRVPLRELELAYTTVSDEGWRCSQTANRSARLGLSYTLVRGSGLRAFQSLEELDLSGASITDEGLAELASLKKLRRLSLKYSDITDAGLRAVEFACRSWSGSI